MNQVRQHSEAVRDLVLSISENSLLLERFSSDPDVVMDAAHLTDEEKIILKGGDLSNLRAWLKAEDEDYIAFMGVQEPPMDDEDEAEGDDGEEMDDDKNEMV